MPNLDYKAPNHNLVPLHDSNTTHWRYQRTYQNRRRSDAAKLRLRVEAFVVALVVPQWETWSYSPWM